MEITADIEAHLLVTLSRTRAWSRLEASVTQLLECGVQIAFAAHQSILWGECVLQSKPEMLTVDQVECGGKKIAFICC